MYTNLFMKLAEICDFNALEDDLRQIADAVKKDLAEQEEQEKPAKEEREWEEQEEDYEPEPCPTCGDIDGMVNPCCAGYDPLHYKNCGYG